MSNISIKIGAKRESLKIANNYSVSAFIHQRPFRVLFLQMNECIRIILKEKMLNGRIHNKDEQSNLT